MSAVIGTPAPYRPPPLPLGLAVLHSALSSRAALKGGVLRYVPALLPERWTPAATFRLDAGGVLFRLEFAALDFLAAHPALDDVDIEALPEDARQAAVEMTLFPFQEKLERLLDFSLLPAPERAASARWLDAPAGFALDFAQDERAWTIFLRLSVETEEGAHWLAARIMQSLPGAWLNPEASGWPVEAAVLAGTMRLPLADLEILKAGDILLPPEYSAAKGRLSLAFSPEAGFALTVAGGVAAVAAPLASSGFHAERESAMPPENQTASANPVASGAWEVEIAFELGKQRLSLAEALALAPGKTFPLGMDPLSAVTVTLNGQALANARLVDLNGTLGVQITRLAGQPQPAP
jgi:type III secretion system YscQ/HrcQ family protein